MSKDEIQNSVFTKYPDVSNYTNRQPAQQQSTQKFANASLTHLTNTHLTKNPNTITTFVLTYFR